MAAHDLLHHRSRRFAGTADAGGGTRTPDTRIMIPLLHGSTAPFEGAGGPKRGQEMLAPMLSAGTTHRHRKDAYPQGSRACDLEPASHGPRPRTGKKPPATTTAIAARLPSMNRDMADAIHVAAALVASAAVGSRHPDSHAEGAARLMPDRPPMSGLCRPANAG